MAESKARLLIVDDNEMNRDILSRQLLRSGFDVDTADHGRTALKMLDTVEYDLVLLDLMMPDIDGMEVLREIRKTKALSQLPVILVSANDQSENMVEAFEHGANDYVLKPIDFPVILARIKMHMGQRSAAGQGKVDQNQPAPAPTRGQAPKAFPESTAKAQTERGSKSKVDVVAPSPEGVEKNINNGQEPDVDDQTVIIGDRTMTLAPLQQGDELEAGTSFGNYQVVGTLGKGAMGIVYEAKNKLLEEHVALKVLPPSIQVDRDAVARFRLEARSAAKVEHPNVVPIYDVGHWDNIYFIAMQLIRGSSVGDLIKDHGAMDWREATRIIADVLRALVAAHACGLIHRDIKPGNILLDESGQVKVTDFGLAKLLKGTPVDQTTMPRTRTIIGTPLFMSPEQIQEAPMDIRSDIYSVGATYFACLTGKSPFPGSGIDVLWAHCVKAVPDPCQMVKNLPEACGQIIMRAMAKELEDRFQSAQEMLDKVELFLNS